MMQAVATVSRGTLFALALVAVVGHVCILPFETHAEARPAKPPLGDGSGPSHQVPHLESCEAIQQSPSADQPAVVDGMQPVSVGEFSPGSAALFAPVSAAVERLPRYLLHASLLI